MVGVKKPRDLYYVSLRKSFFKSRPLLLSILYGAGNRNRNKNAKFVEILMCPNDTESVIYISGSRKCLVKQLLPEEWNTAFRFRPHKPEKLYLYASIGFRRANRITRVYGWFYEPWYKFNGLLIMFPGSIIIICFVLL